jgi:hypothetical protein
MWDFSRDVQWWEERQLRILVFGSFSLQLVLFAGSMVREVRALKPCLWLAYIGADAVAIYALSTLFNRHKAPPAGDESSSSALEVLWAPVLLLHLGGHHKFTAYSIEDNELWGRQLVILVSQVAVAVYVFCKPWPTGGDRWLLQAAVLLFIIGILKFAQKSLALRAASFKSLMTSSAVYPQRRRARSATMCYWMIFISNVASEASIMDAEMVRDEEDHDLSLDEYVRKAKEELAPLLAPEDGAGPAPAPAPATRSSLTRPIIDKNFVDMSNPYRRRLTDLSSYFKLDLRDVDLDLRESLHTSFSLIYTNFKAAFGVPGCLLMLMLPSMSLASAILFDRSHKAGYKEEDVKATRILLWCTTAVAFLQILLCGPCLFLQITAAQQSLVSFAARRSKPTGLMKLSGVVGLKDYANKYWYIKHEPADLIMASVVSQHVKDGWAQYIVDAASYKRFNNLRGQWAMSRRGVRDPRLLWSLQVPFDHSVLVWHVATDLCLHQQQQQGTSAAAARRCSELISNYMIYLLLVRPEMLLPGTRQGLFTNTADDMEAMLKHNADVPGTPPLNGARDVAQRILGVARSPSLRVGPWILRACELAQGLMEMELPGGDDEERWLLIQGVWVEMLCYSASRCRGYLHAKSLGEGVELLTFVWLLWSRLGMETFADKFQRPEPAPQGETDTPTTHPTQASEPQQMANAVE